MWFPESQHILYLGKTLLFLWSKGAFSGSHCSETKLYVSFENNPSKGAG